MFFFGGVFTILATKIWDPLWNPFRSKPEQIMEKMLKKIEQLKTYHQDATFLFNYENNGNFEIKGRFNGDMDKSLPDKIKEQVMVNLDFSTEGVNLNAELELKNIGDNYYLKLSKIPGGSMTQLITPFKDQWMKFNIESLKEILGEGYYEKFKKIQQRQKEEQEVIVKEIKRLFKNKKIYLVKKEFPDEKIGNKKVYRYQVALNNEEIKKIIPDFLDNILKNLNLGDFSSMVEFSLFDKEFKIMNSLSKLSLISDKVFREGGYSYSKLSCNYNSEISKLCEEIAKITEAKPVIHASSKEYCAYVSLPIKGYYYCIDNKESLNITTNPEQPRFCDGKTFSCPEPVSEEELKIAREKSAKELFLKEVDKFFEKIGEISADLWIGKNDHYLYKIKGEKMFEIKEDGKNSKIFLSVDINFSNFNQPVEIEEPKEYKDLLEVLKEGERAFNQDLEFGEPSMNIYAVKRTNMAILSNVASLIYFDNNTFQGLCKDRFTLNTSFPKYEKELLEINKNILPLSDCRSAKESYCIITDINKTGIGQLCIDNTSLVEEIPDGTFCTGDGTKSFPYRCPQMKKYLPQKEHSFPFQSSLFEALLYLFRK